MDRKHVFTRGLHPALNIGLVIGLLLQIFFLAAPPVSAASTATNVVGTGDASTCTDATLTSALSIGGSITFNCGPNPVTITVSGQKTIAANTSIDGGGSITLDGGGATSIFSVNAGATLSLANLTVSNANGSTSVGGAIANAGTLNITNSTLSNNTTHNSGGAIYSSTGSTLTISNTTFSQNTAQATNNTAGNSGGAIYSNGAAVSITNSTFSYNAASNSGGAIYYNGANATLTISNTSFLQNTAGNSGGGIYNNTSSKTGALNVTGSTFSGNKATNSGGAIYNNTSGTLTVLDSTLSGNSVSGNTATGNGGGLANVQGAASLNNATIASNTATNGNGGGIAVSGGTVSIANTIVSGNSSAGSSPDCSGTISSQGYNLVGNASGCTIGGSLTGNLTGTASNPVDPKLLALTDNSGPTETMALPSGSPAIGTGNPAAPDGQGNDCLQFDQRGVQRLQGACDIGAFEVARGPVVTPSSGAQTATELSSTSVSLGTLTEQLSAASPWSVDVNWGDGSSDTSFTVTATGSLGTRSHTYPAVPGSKAFNVTVSVKDKYNLTGSASFPVTVQAELNDAWTKAHSLNLTAANPLDLSNLSAQFGQYIYQPGQSKWYKFTVQPGSKVAVTLSNLPANYDLVLYKDIATAYSTLKTTQDLAHINAELPYNGFNSDAVSGEAFTGEAFTGEAFTGEAFTGEAFTGEAFTPDAVTGQLGTADPNAYASAQTRSLLAVSALDGTADENIVANTWDNSGNFYLRVRGRNGISSPASPFQLQVTQLTGQCANVAPITTPSSLTASGPNFKTLVLTDYHRLPSSQTADLAALQTTLGSFVARPEVAGAPVVDVSQDAAVAAANAQADKYPGCPTAKNYVAQTIKGIVDKYRAANPGLQYLVIVGGDNVIPFFREPDQADLADENNYFPPVLDASASQASLRDGYVLSQDRYGESSEISFKSTTLPIPGLAVGRLVETASEATGMLNAYLATTGGVIQPSSSLVTGYDFLADDAQAVATQLQAGIGAAPDTLIEAGGLPPTDPSAWTASQLSAQLLGKRHDLVFLAGHFSQGSALAADYSTQLQASDVAASTANLTNAIIFSAGCHSGYNTVDADAVNGVTGQPDWPQAFARKQATLIGGAGYQYGDTDFIKYSETLYLEFSKQLRTGSGAVPIGAALVAAKQAYLANTARMQGIDAKVLLESTLYGLPMLSVNMPGQRLAPSSDSSVIASATPYATGPGAALGLGHADLTVNPTLTTNTVRLTDISTGATANATYLSGGNGVVSNPFEPVLPLEVRNVTVANTVLRGVGFRGGSYTDVPGVLPLVDAPATDLGTVHAPFFSDTFYPAQSWTTNYFDALANQNGATRLDVTPAQFQSASPGSLTGTLREFSSMTFRLYYSNNLNPPALSAAPDIWRVSGVPSSGNVQFKMNVQGNPTAGIQEVWITYTCAVAGYSCSGTWVPLDLTQDATDSTLWEGALQLPTGLDASNIHYIVQAANGVGLVTLATNFGATYLPGQVVTTSAPTSLTLTPTSTSGAYGTPAAFRATLTSNGSPVPNQPLVFAIGSQSQVAITDSNGTAQASVTLLVPPGPYEVRVTFAGTTDFQASSAATSSATPFSVTKQGTQLSLSPTSVSVQRGGITSVVATLIDSAGRPIPQRTVAFIVNPTGSPYVTTAITDYLGRAPLGAVPLPSGTYGVSACFGGGTFTVGSQSVTLTDDVYSSSPAGGCTSPPASGSLTLTPADTTTTLSSSTNPSTSGQAVTFTARVSGVAGNLGFPTGSVTFNDAGTAISACSNVALSGGTATCATSSLAVGSHSITAVYGGDPNFNSSTSSVLTQTVAVTTTPFNFTGFFSPLAPTTDPLTLNVVKAGSGVPVKFSLGGNQGLNIFASGYPSLQPQACPVGSPTNTVSSSQTVNTTTSYLSFNATTNQYVYVWKTSSAWAGSCGVLHVKLSDGTDHLALFQFR